MDLGCITFDVGTFKPIYIFQNTKICVNIKIDHFICICIYLHSINLYKDVETVIITICNLHMV